MASFRFWRRLNFGVGTLNLQKGVPSVSVGRKGCKYTVSPKTGTGATFGLTGTGLFYSTKSQGNRRKKSVGLPAKDCNKLLKVIMMTEEADWTRALKAARRLPTSADGLYLLGHIALNQNNLTEAAQAFGKAIYYEGDLGLYFSALGVFPDFSYVISSGGFVVLQPGLAGAVCGQIMTQECMGNEDYALQFVYDYGEVDPVVKLLGIDILIGKKELTEELARRVLDMIGLVKASNEESCMVICWQAKAQSALGLYDVAKETIQPAIRKAKSPEVLLELRYERGLILEKLGHSKRAKVDWQWCFSQEPDFRDVTDRVKKGEK